jgi:thiamine-phosphate pyrophosphorylase
VKPLSQCHLYTFVDTAYLHGRNPLDVAQQLCDGGSDIVQLRAKDASLDQIRRMASLILPVTTRAGVWLVINDYPTVAAEAGAPLCHLGQEDFFDAGHTHVSQITRLAPRLKVGLSTHSPAQAERAIAAGPVYIAVGPVYATGTKPKARPVTLDYVRWATANVPVPWFAIGGITLQNLDDVLEAGACRVCVVSAILNAPDIVRACQQFRNRLLFAGP